MRRRTSKFNIWRRRLVAVALVVLGLAAIYLFWFRNSSLFDVHKVEITGVTADAPQVDAALVGAARDMTTLHVDEPKLIASVSRFPTIGSLKVDSVLPHELKITVTERAPVALARSGGASVPVSADGYVLRGIRAPSGLPSFAATQQPAGPRLDERDTEQAELLAALPRSLRSGVGEARFDAAEEGVVVELRDGIELRLGDATRAAAKWAAAAAVLSDPKLGSPAYIDVSVPDRPVSGGYSG